MKPIFEIEFVVNHFGSTNLGHYFGLIKQASISELKEFRKCVIDHKKQAETNIAFSNVPGLSTHQVIINAINHELLKRSWRFRIFKFIFPFRQWLVKTFSGLELEEHEVFGILYSKPKYRKSVWHLSHTKLLKILAEFWLKHWKFIIGTSIPIIVLILRLIGKL